jgi:hypothetical protein
MDFFTYKNIPPRHVKLFESESGERNRPESLMCLVDPRDACIPRKYFRMHPPKAGEEKTYLQELDKDFQETDTRRGTNRSTTSAGSGRKTTNERRPTNGSRKASRKPSVNQEDDAASTTSVNEESAIEQKLREEEEALQRLLARMPKFLRERREEVQVQLKKIGIPSGGVQRILREGAPTDNIEALADFISRTGFGKPPGYKELWEAVTVEGQHRDEISLDEHFLNKNADRLLGDIAEILHCDRVSMFVLRGTYGDHMKAYAKGAKSWKQPRGQGIAGQVFEHGGMVNIKDCYRYAYFDRDHDLATGYTTRSMVAAPIFCTETEEPVAVIAALNKLPKAAYNEEKRLRHLLAVPFGRVDEIAMKKLQNLLSPVFVEDGVKDLESFIAECWKVKPTAQQQHDINLILPARTISVFIILLRQLFNCDRTCLLTYNPDSATLLLHASHLPRPVQMLPSSPGLYPTLFNDMANVKIDEGWKDARIDHEADKKAGYRTDSLVAVPIVVDEECTAVLVLLNKLPLGIDMLAADRHLHAEPFTGFDERVIGALAEELAKHIPNAEIPLAKVFCKVLNDFHFKPDIMKMMKHILKTSEMSPLDKPSAKGTCRVCYIRPIEIELRPCRHRLACLQCSPPPGGVCFFCKRTVWEARRLHKRDKEVSGGRRSYLGREIPSEREPSVKRNASAYFSIPDPPLIAEDLDMHSRPEPGLQLPGALQDIFNKYD